MEEDDSSFQYEKDADFTYDKILQCVNKKSRIWSYYGYPATREGKIIRYVTMCRICRKIVVSSARSLTYLLKHLKERHPEIKELPSMEDTNRSKNSDKSRQNGDKDSAAEKRTRKTQKKCYAETGVQSNRLYDEKGILIAAGVDTCDCLDTECPGCHFPCPKCRSPKCGHECRNNRKWMYEYTEIEGSDQKVYNKYRGGNNS